MPSKGPRRAVHTPLERAPGEPDWLAAAEGLRGAYAESTLRTGRLLFEYFLAWCRKNGHQAFPPSPKVIAAWVDLRFAEGLRGLAVMTELYAIRWMMRALGLPDTTLTWEVQLAVRRGKRTYGVRRRQVPAINADLRDRLSAACPETAAGIRDRVILALGYDTLCRAGELSRLLIEDLRPHADGTAEILVRQEKQDPSRSGSVAYISADTYGLVQWWLAVSGHREGPIVRTVRGRHIYVQGMRPIRLNDRLRALGQRIGLEPEIAKRLTCHSLRIGAVQDLTIAGRSLLQIMRAGRWRHVDSVISYARATPVNVWAVDDGDTYAIVERRLNERRQFMSRHTRAERRRKEEDRAAAAERSAP